MRTGPAVVHEEVGAVIPNPFDRRQAERFAQLLDEAQGFSTVRSHRVTDELAELVTTACQHAEELSELVVEVTPDPAYRQSLRRRLLAVAHTQGIGETTGEPVDDLDVRRPRPRRGAKLALVASVVVGVLGVSGISTASGDAIPGDALYGVKRQTERAQLALAGSDVNRGQLYLGFARTRLKEATAVDDSQAVLRAALDEMDANTRRGTKLLARAAVERRDSTVLENVDVFASQQRRWVVQLAAGLNGEERERALESLQLISKAAKRSSDLRQNLICTDDRDVRFDELGPLPQRCSAMPAPTEAPRPIESESEPGAASRGVRGAAPSTMVAPPAPAPQPDDRTEAPDDDLPGKHPVAVPSMPEEPIAATIVEELKRILGDLLR
ncbi:MAG: DUF5667 domain-containing protein [Micromonosporaceae bacterium]